MSWLWEVRQRLQEKGVVLNAMLQQELGEEGMTCRQAYDQVQSDEKFAQMYQEMKARAEKAEAELAEAKALLADVFDKSCRYCCCGDECQCTLSSDKYDIRWHKTGRDPDCPYIKWEEQKYDCDK
jgi:hypothetical protein